MIGLLKDKLFVFVHWSEVWEKHGTALSTHQSQSRNHSDPLRKLLSVRKYEDSLKALKAISHLIEIQPKEQPRRVCIIDHEVTSGHFGFLSCAYSSTVRSCQRTWAAEMWVLMLWPENGRQVWEICPLFSFSHFLLITSMPRGGNRTKQSSLQMRSHTWSACFIFQLSNVLTSLARFPNFCLSIPHSLYIPLKSDFCWLSIMKSSSEVEKNNPLYALHLLETPLFTVISYDSTKL